MFSATPSDLPEMLPPVWQASEALSDLLAGMPDLQGACALGLQFVLEALGRTAGVLDVPRPGLLIHHGLPEHWAAQLDDPASPLRCLVQEVQIGGRPKYVGPDLAAAIPVPFQAAVQGVLLVQGEPCSEREITWLEQMVRPLGRAIGQYGLFQATPKGSRDLAALRSLVTGWDFSCDIEARQNGLVQGICHALDVELCALMLLEEGSGETVNRTVVSQNFDLVYQFNARLEPGLIKDCLDNGRSLWVNDLGSDPRFDPTGDALAGLQPHSLLCAPLLADGRSLGILVAADKRSGPFHAGDQDLLVVVATLMAQAIHAGRLVRQLKAANEELKAGRDELQNNSTTLRTLFDRIPAAVYIIDRAYRLVSVNAGCALRRGGEPQDLAGRLCFEALHGLGERCSGCRVNETLLAGATTNRIESRPVEGDDPVEWEVSSYPALMEGSQVAQAILFEQDVSEKRRLENILAQSEKLAAVGQLAAGVAHEINNPLTAIIANAQLLQRGLAPGDELQESVDLIARAGARATQVVRNLLDFARKEQYHLAPTDVNETIRRSLALVQHELLARSITLTFEPDTNLPAVMASQDHLQGLWLNLFMNAIDSIDNSQGMLRVTSRLAGEEVRVAVADNGKGIPSERIGRIFEPFYTTKAPGRGTGLGLSVCHRIVKQHGGNIQVESQLGQGSEFTVTLPINGAA